MRKVKTMDFGLIGALVLLLAWAIGALVLEAPGWIHLLLTIGVSLFIFRIVARSSAAENMASTSGDTKPR